MDIYSLLSRRLYERKVAIANARFQQGMSTIILPRAIALQCQLNGTLYDLASLSTGDPLYGASFYSTDPASISASGHVIAVISKNVTATQAELILTKLTHNSTGGRIGNNVTISPTSVYLLHLPNDILSTIPTFVNNSGMGEGPNYLNPLGIISDIAGMAFNFLVWVASGGLLLLFVHLVEMGLEAIGNLLSAAASAVQDAVDAIVDAFAAFVDWAIEFIMSTANAIFGPIGNAVGDAVMNYCSGISAAMHSADSDIDSTGSVSTDSINKLHDSLRGELYWLIFGVVLTINIALIILQVVTNIFGFLIGMAAGLLISVFINIAFNAQSAGTWAGDCMASMSVSDTQEWLQEVDTGNGTRTLPDEVGWAGGGIGLGVLTTILTFADIEIAKDAGNLLAISIAKKEVVLAIIGFSIGFISTLVDDQLLGFVGMLLSAGAMFLSWAASYISGFDAVSVVWMIISTGFSGFGMALSAKGLGWL